MLAVHSVFSNDQQANSKRACAKNASELQVADEAGLDSYPIQRQSSFPQTLAFFPRSDPGPCHWGWEKFAQLFAGRQAMQQAVHGQPETMAESRLTPARELLVGQVPHAVEEKAQADHPRGSVFICLAALGAGGRRLGSFNAAKSCTERYRRPGAVVSDMSANIPSSGRAPTLGDPSPSPHTYSLALGY